MGNKPTNAIKGLQGFQKTGRKDPAGHSSGFFGRMMQRLGFGSDVPSTGRPAPSAYPPPPRLDYQAPYQAFSSQGQPPTGIGWPEAQTLGNDERRRVWSEVFGRSERYGPHRRFDIHEKKHDHIADMTDLIKAEGNTPRRVGRPGVDDFAYVRNGDIELQVLAARNLASAILDLDTPEYRRYEGLGVYSPETIRLAKELEEAGCYNDQAFMQRGEFVQPDGTMKTTDVINHKVWRLVQLVERDQENSEKLQTSRTKRPISQQSARFTL